MNITPPPAILPAGFYVYLHYRASTGRVCYVGKGQRGRAWSARGRNRHWLRCAAKHGIAVDVVADGLSEPCAFDMECAFIAALGGAGEKLCNQTSGGEGGALTGAGLAKLRATMATDEYLGAMRAKTSARWKDPAARERVLVAMEKSRARPDYRENLRAAAADPVKKAAKREAMARYYASPGASEKVSETTRRVMARPGVRQNLSEVMKAKLADPAEVEKRRSAAILAWQTDADLVRRFRAVKARPVFCIDTGAHFETLGLALQSVRPVAKPGGGSSLISECCRGLRETAYGLRWRWAEKSPA